MRIMKMAWNMKDCLFGEVFDQDKCELYDLKKQQSSFDDEMLKQRTELMKILAMPVALLAITLIVAFLLVTCCCFAFLMTTEKGCFGRWMTMKLGSSGNRDDEEMEMANTKKERTENHFYL